MAHKYLEVGDSESIVAGDISGVDVMSAAGSVVIRSNSAREMLVSDAPSATSGAVKVTYMTSAPLPAKTGFEPAEEAGWDSTILTAYLPFDTDQDKSIPVLGDVKASDIKHGDRILVKDGITAREVEGITVGASSTFIRNA